MTIKSPDLIFFGFVHYQGNNGTYLGFLEKVFLSDLSCGVQVRTSILFGHHYLLFNGTSAKWHGVMVKLCDKATVSIGKHKEMRTQQGRPTSDPPPRYVKGEKEQYLVTMWSGRIFPLARCKVSDVRYLQTERPYVYLRTPRDPLRDSTGHRGIAFTKGSGCHGGDRWISFFSLVRTGCAHYASAVRRRLAWADRRGSAGPPSQHLPLPATLSTVRRDGRRGRDAATSV